MVSVKREGKGGEVNLAYLVGDLGGHCSEVGGREGFRVEREAVGVVGGEGWFGFGFGIAEMWKCRIVKAQIGFGLGWFAVRGGVWNVGWRWWSLLCCTMCCSRAKLHCAKKKIKT